MYLFDLHCDTLTRLHTGERLKPGDNRLCSNHAHLALERMGQGWCQCFAIFLPDEYRGQAAVDYFEDHYRYFLRQLEENPSRLVQVRTAGEIEAALACGKVAAMLTVEGGSVLAGQPSRVRRLAECGVRVLTLTWNGANELGSGNLTEQGLTSFGRQAIALLEQAGIVVDVSHLNDCGFWEVAELAKRPFIATHSNARAVHPHPRNLTDAQFCRIAEAGGLVGINLCTHFISDQPDPDFAQLAAHIEHFLQLGGEHVLALGSDYDGADVPTWLQPGERLRELYPMLCRRFGARIAERIFYTNAIEFFTRYSQTVS